MYLHLKQSPNTSDFEKVWKQCSKEFSLQDLAEADEVAQERTIYQHFLSTVLLHSAFIQVNTDQVFFPSFQISEFQLSGHLFSKATLRDSIWKTIQKYVFAASQGVYSYVKA